MPALDAALGFGVAGLGVDQLDPEVGADHLERVGDVGRAEVDVVRPRRAEAGDRREQDVLVGERALVGAEAAADDVAGRGVEDRDQVRIALAAVLAARVRAVHRVAVPQVARVLGQEGAPLEGVRPRRPQRQRVRLQQAMHGRALQLALPRPAGALEGPDQHVHRAPRLLALGREQLLGDFGPDRPAGVAILAGPGHQRPPAALEVDVEPVLEGPRREPHALAVGALVLSRRRLGEVAPSVAVLQPRADQGAQSGDAPQGQGLGGFGVKCRAHAAPLPGMRGHSRWGAPARRPRLGGPVELPVTSCAPPGPVDAAAPRAPAAPRPSSPRRTPRAARRACSRAGSVAPSPPTRAAARSPGCVARPARSSAASPSSAAAFAPAPAAVRLADAASARRPRPPTAATAAARAGPGAPARSPRTRSSGSVGSRSARAHRPAAPDTVARARAAAGSRSSGTPPACTPPATPAAAGAPASPPRRPRSSCPPSDWTGRAGRGRRPAASAGRRVVLWAVVGTHNPVPQPSPFPKILGHPRPGHGLDCELRSQNYTRC